MEVEVVLLVPVEDTVRAVGREGFSHIVGLAHNAPGRRR